MKNKTDIEKRPWQCGNLLVIRINESKLASEDNFFTNFHFFFNLLLKGNEVK